MGIRKMEFFKKKCRDILGPSKTVLASNNLNLETFEDGEFLDDQINAKIN